MERADLTGVVLDGRYRILEPVAQGAMGVVYRAERIKLGRIVAVKVLHDSLPAELSSRRRFEIEAKAMAKLEHPHCAAVVDIGLHEDRPFVVMDFVSGQNLKDVIAAEAPLPIPRAVEILRQILSGLAHAHEHGIIHRDIKPANLVLSQKAGLGDHIKILDFGLARLSQDSSLTTGVVVGTPSYMAPEQIRGQPIDGRVDVYACGVILFEMLTGTKPFVSAKDDPIEVCSLHLKAPVPRLADCRPDLDFGGLEDIVARALAKSTGDRFASAVEFAAALDELVPRRASITPIAGTPIAATPSLEPRPTLEYAGAAPLSPRTTPAPGVRTLPMPPLDSPRDPASATVPDPAPAPDPALSSASSLPSAVLSASDLILDEPASRSVPPSAASFPPSGATSAGVAPFPPPGAASASGASVAPSPSGVTAASGASVAPSRAPAAPSRRRGRRLAFAAGALVLLAAVIVALAAASRDDSAKAPPDAAGVASAGSAAPAPDPAGEDFARVSELIAGGEKAAALDLALAGRKRHPEDARFPYLIGQLYFDKYYWTEGMKMFREAIRLDPTYRTDRELIRTVLRGFITTPRPEASLAAFLREDIGDAAKPYLEETASDHPNPNIRARAANELRRYR